MVVTVSQTGKIAVFSETSPYILNVSANTTLLITVDPGVVENPGSRDEDNTKVQDSVEARVQGRSLEPVAHHVVRVSSGTSVQWTEDDLTQLTTTMWWRAPRDFFILLCYCHVPHGTTV